MFNRFSYNDDHSANLTPPPQYIEGLRLSGLALRNNSRLGGAEAMIRSNAASLDGRARPHTTIVGSAMANTQQQQLNNSTSASSTVDTTIDNSNIAIISTITPVSDATCSSGRSATGCSNSTSNNNSGGGGGSNLIPAAHLFEGGAVSLPTPITGVVVGDFGDSIHVTQDTVSQLPLKTPTGLSSHQQTFTLCGTPALSTNGIIPLYHTSTPAHSNPLPLTITSPPTPLTPHPPSSPNTPSSGGAAYILGGLGGRRVSEDRPKLDKSHSTPAYDFGTDGGTAAPSATTAATNLFSTSSSSPSARDRWVLTVVLGVGGGT